MKTHIAPVVSAKKLPWKRSLASEDVENRGDGWVVHTAWTFPSADNSGLDWKKVGELHEDNDYRTVHSVKPQWEEDMD